MNDLELWVRTQFTKPLTPKPQKFCTAVGCGAKLRYKRWSWSQVEKDRGKRHTLYEKWECPDRWKSTYGNDHHFGVKPEQPTDTLYEEDFDYEQR